jgi:hypothetical protein
VVHGFENQSDYESRITMVLKVQPIFLNFLGLVLNNPCEMKLCGLFERIQWCMALKSVNPYEQRFIVFDCHPCEERNELTLVFLMKLMGILSLLIPGSLIL